MSENLITVGWREWVYLPDLHLDKIKAKVDTGARTSCLHAFKIEPYTEDGIEKVHFYMHPIQDNTDVVTECDAVVLDKRNVTDSGGHMEERYVISTRILMGPIDSDIEMTLTDRDTMKFRMLLGRTAMKDKVVVNPAKSFLLQKNYK